MEIEKLRKLAKLIRCLILVSSTKAGSGHPTSSLSAADIMTALLFGGFFKFDLDNPENLQNDRLIFSKGHASALFYALFAAAGAISEEEIMTLRKFGSRLEGHPTMEFPYTEVPTGSLGQGLSAGVGMALNSKYLDKSNYKTFVLLGDSEMAEGSNWEALQVASHYKLDNLIGILDVNRLGQSRETMHSLPKIISTYKKALKVRGKPVMIIAKTLKGKGVSFLENKEGWHGKPLPQLELEKALVELGEVDRKIRGKIAAPSKANGRNHKKLTTSQAPTVSYQKGEMIATRKAYGNALVKLASQYPNIVALDGETSNSTYSEFFAKANPERYFEMFIAEQNMAGVALGLAKMGKIPFISTFAAFFSRAYDQIRMAQYSNTNVKYVGSHAGVSIGEDGASQMGLEDIAMFRTLLGSVVLYPSDAVSSEKLTEIAASHKGIVYLRTTRKETPVIYSQDEQFVLGGSKVLKKSSKDKVTLIGAGVTLQEALAAYELLKEEKIIVRVIDLYSIKPLDIKTLTKAAKETKAIITVEDHHLEGGLGEAVASAVGGLTKVYHLAVEKMPRSGKPAELLDYEEISAQAIAKLVKKIVS
ncbi:transketolase [Candidatus Daviesbacteria bacterium]|nr:transketolase [Candidatus Daviesbacteria bacterium]